ncbi:MAG TPA: hypothetical protein VKT81_00130 [Bryobacteraceae bacterium]|nr:hypothetical protein [Bryobacteraceae bacterium]
MRRFFILALVAALGTLPGSTLRQLTLDDMIRQSTMIVRGTVQATTVQYHGSTIFSHYSIQVTETYKSSAQTAASSIDFGVPGGSLNGAIQRVAGAPNLTPGQDYVLFLWTSKSGLTQVIGLSQGLFSVISTPGTAPTVMRAAAAEQTLNSAGQPVTTNDINMSLSALKAEIASVLGTQTTP